MFDTIQLGQVYWRGEVEEEKVWRREEKKSGEWQSK